MYGPKTFGEVTITKRIGLQVRSEILHKKRGGSFGDEIPNKMCFVTNLDKNL